MDDYLGKYFGYCFCSTLEILQTFDNRELGTYITEPCLKILLLGSHIFKMTLTHHFLSFQVLLVDVSVKEQSSCNMFVHIFFLHYLLSSVDLE